MRDLRALEMRRTGLGRDKNRMKYVNICSSHLRKMMIHCPYGLHCLMRSISALCEFRPRIPAFAAPYLYCVYTLADLSGQLRYFQGSMTPARMQTKIIPTALCLLSVSARKLCLLSEKHFSLSENGQCRTIHKRKANNRPAKLSSPLPRVGEGPGVRGIVISNTHPLPRRATRVARRHSCFLVAPTYSHY